MNVSIDAPLTVMFLLLSRPVVSNVENSIHHPSGNNEASDIPENPFVSEPNDVFERWDEYWRKVHGSRILHADHEEDVNIIQRLLRYDQIHRVAAGPTSLYPPPYHPPVDNQGQLFDTILGHVENYKRPQWDGAAYLCYRSVEDFLMMSNSERTRLKIQPENETMFRDFAPVLAKQFIVLPSETNNDAITLVKTHTRQQHLDRVAFQDRWLNQHAQVIVVQSETEQYVKRYVQLHNIASESEDDPFFNLAASRIDGISILSFASMKDVESFLLSDAYKQIVEDEQSFSRPDMSEYWTGVTFSVVNQLQPELSTMSEG